MPVVETRSINCGSWFEENGSWLGTDWVTLPLRHFSMAHSVKENGKGVGVGLIDANDEKKLRLGTDSHSPIPKESGPETHFENSSGREDEDEDEEDDEEEEEEDKDAKQSK
ncbi:hypothetical protein M0802_007649 [Mischocyttarus mexicanus]|nr:hypothetical protein M0802_007649 [Mischocyttarus mexicanus]